MAVTIIVALVALALGGLIGWLVMRPRQAAMRQQLVAAESEQARKASAETALTAQLESFRQENTTLQAEKSALEKEIAILEKQIQDNQKRSNSALSSLTLVQKKVANRRTLLRRSEHEIRVINDSIYARQKEINRITERLDTMTYYYGKLVKNAYKNRDARIWYMYILASENLNQASRRYGYLRNLSGEMNSQASKIKESRQELENKIEELKVTKEEAEKLRKSHQAELESLRKEEADAQKLVKQLNTYKTRYQTQLNTKKKQVTALDRQIRDMINKAMSASSSSKKSGSGAKTSTAVDTKLSGQFEANKGKLPWPVEGVIIESFGQHYHPVYKSVKLPFNNGVNVAVDPGTDVRAVFDGEVRQVIVMPGYNKCILVQHGNYFTFYCKLASVTVKAGQKISTGQVLGRVDTISGETQVHFQLWKGRTPQDPENWLKPRG